MARRPTNPRIVKLEADIRSFESLAKKAERAKSFQAAVAARSRLATLRVDLARLVEAAAEPAGESPLQRTRRLRVAAQREGSWVAAEKLLERERALELEEAAATAAAEKAEGDSLSDDELVAVLVEALRAMPRSLRERVIRESLRNEPAPQDDASDADGDDDEEGDDSCA